MGRGSANQSVNDYGWWSAWEWFDLVIDGEYVEGSEWKSVVQQAGRQLALFR